MIIIMSCIQDMSHSDKTIRMYAIDEITRTAQVKAKRMTPPTEHVNDAQTNLDAVSKSPFLTFTKACWKERDTWLNKTEMLVTPVKILRCMFIFQKGCYLSTKYVY